MDPQTSRRTVAARASKRGCVWNPDQQQARIAISALELERSLRVARWLLDLRDAGLHAESSGNARLRCPFAAWPPVSARLEQRLYALFAD